MARTRSSLSRWALGHGIALATVMGPGMALAQTETQAGESATSRASELQAADTVDSTFGDIVVTAQKRLQNAQSVGISITAFNSAQIKALGLTEPVSIAQQTPGVSFSSLHQGNATFNIRGVSQNDFADHYEPPVALYVDEAYVPHQAAGRSQLFDIQRVEVLRGPQGTLFGRNSTGGLVHIISEQPGDAFTGYATVTYGEYDLRTLEAAVGGPLTEKLRARVAFQTNNQDGWFKNRIGPDLADQNNYAGRAIIEFEPTLGIKLNLKIYGSSNNNESGQGFANTPTVLNAEGLGVALAPDQIGSWPNIVTGGIVTGQCPGCDITGYREPDTDPRTGSVDRGDFDRRMHGATLKVTSDFGGVKLTSISDYLYIRKYLDGDPDGGPAPYFRYITAQKSRDFSQELRLDGATGDLRWQFGGYYLTMDSDYESRVDLDLSPYLGLPNGSFLGTTRTTWGLKVESWAAFAQAEYDIAPTVTVIGGVRYTHDIKKVDAIFDDRQLGGAQTAFNPGLFPDLARQTYENVSIRAEVDWKPAPGLLFYASYNRGHKGGNWAMPVFGLNPDPVLRATLDYPSLPVDQEVLTSYEVGAKATFWDGRARLNVSAYYYDYNDYQVFSLRGAVQQLFNRDASISGGEAELSLAPMDGLNITVGTAVMWKKTVKNVPLPLGPADQEMPLSPDVTANALVRYAWSAFGGELAIQADANWTDGFYFYAVNSPVTFQGAYAVANGRISYTAADERWDLSLWVKNLTDTDYFNFRLDVGSLSYCGCGVAAPRQIGGTVSFRW
jgi:iron complex outermembrane recepter protein